MVKNMEKEKNIIKMEILYLKVNILKVKDGMEKEKKIMNMDKLYLKVNIFPLMMKIKGME